MPGAQVVGATSLAEVAAALRRDRRRARGRAGAPRRPCRARPGGSALDLADVVGQDDARACLEVAAAGGHHLLMVGPPGTGKTMLAARLPGLLPDLSEADAVEVTAVHSVAGAFDPGGGLLRRPPFEDPHHTATPASVVGGGSGVPRPGAASRAHRGVLFLDEAPEFSTRGAADAAAAAGARRAGAPPRRAARPATRPGSSSSWRPTRARAGRRSARGSRARAAASSGAGTSASCPGPLLDRVDLQVELSPCAGGCGGAGSRRRVVAARVLDARAAQARAARRDAVAHQRRRPGQLAAGAAGPGPRAGRGPGPRARSRHAEPARRRPGAAGRVDAGGPGGSGGARARRRRARPPAAHAGERRMSGDGAEVLARATWSAWWSPGTPSPGRSSDCSARRRRSTGSRAAVRDGPDLARARGRGTVRSPTPTAGGSAKAVARWAVRLPGCDPRRDLDAARPARRHARWCRETLGGRRRSTTSASRRRSACGCAATRTSGPSLARSAAVVGSRAATSYGERVAFDLADGLTGGRRVRGLGRCVRHRRGGAPRSRRPRRADASSSSRVVSTGPTRPGTRDCSRRSWRPGERSCRRCHRAACRPRAGSCSGTG